MCSAIAFESYRQIRVDQNGWEGLKQVNMGWDEVEAVMVMQRSKRECARLSLFPRTRPATTQVSRLSSAQIAATLPQLADGSERYMTKWMVPN